VGDLQIKWLQIVLGQMITLLDYGKILAQQQKYIRPVTRENPAISLLEPKEKT